MPNGRYGDVVRRLRPGAVDAGDIVHVDGSILGRHNGVIIRLASAAVLGLVGGAGVDESEGPLYVVDIDADTNRVIVGPQSMLACAEVHLGDVNWINGTPAEGTPVLARLRNTASAKPANVFDANKAPTIIRLEAPQYGIAAGQAAALYDGAHPERLLGGGIVRAPLMANTL